ncbi:MAG: metallophosphoesterase [Reyranella sp.]|nr:metallophosphoesterase [Reyranella sp.]MBL6652167.1 metallophosphoesterase [Reyranella sp.]
MRRVLAIVALLCLAAAARAQSPAAFAFVLWGEGANGEPVAIARAVVERATTCPVLQRASGAWQSMTPRQRPSLGRFDDVLVCETLYPFGEVAAVVVGDRRLELPLVTAGTPRRVLLMGDSGCRGVTVMKPQPCTGDGFTRVWPFGVIAEDEKRSAADLIVHVGDYNYRNTPRDMVLSPRTTGFAQPMTVRIYDTGDLDDEDDVPEEPLGPGYWSQNMQGSPVPDTWSAWRDDFFVPAARLMKTAPWLFVRGNHELCSRAGPGWFYLLDPASVLLGGDRRQEQCPDQTPAGWQPGAWPRALPFEGQPFPVRITPPMRLKLGDLDLISIDSANAGDVYLYNLDAYVEQFRRVAAILGERRPTWLVTHRPFWGVVRKIHGGPAGSEPYGFINLTEQQALARVFPDGLPANVAAVMSGHMHRFQAIGFGDRRPPQLIVGTAGIVLSHNTPVPPSPDDRHAIQVPRLDGVDAAVTGVMDHGAMLIEPGKHGAWTGVMMSETSRVLATCDSAWPRRDRRQSVCRLQ